MIDLGCLPDTPFPQLEEAVQALQAAGHRVSVDSGDPARAAPRRASGRRFPAQPDGGHAGSRRRHRGGAGDHSRPPRRSRRPGRPCASGCWRAGRPFLADPILDPIHFGFTASIVRYHELRRRLPEVEILMGVGNLTELTDADTTGITMTLMGMVSELAIRNILVVQVSPHCRGAVREAELARRILHAAKADGSLPQGYDPGLLALRDRRPYPNTPDEIAASAAEVGDANFRIEVAEDGIHVYNRDGHQVAADPFALFPQLGGRAGRRACVLPRRRAGARADRASARQALCAGQRAALGLCRAAAAEAISCTSPRPAARWRRGARPAAWRPDAGHPREHRHHAQRSTAARTSRRWASSSRRRSW